MEVREEARLPGRGQAERPRTLLADFFSILLISTPSTARRGRLASVNPGIGPRVGRYTVHLQEFEDLVLSRIDPQSAPAELYVIDEIGRMELLSQKFRTGLTDLLAWPCNLLATIAQKGRGFMDQIRRRTDIELIEVKKENRDQLPETIVNKFTAELGGSHFIL